MTKNILLVDDESIFHFLNTKILSISKVDCTIQSAYDGKQALQLLEEGSTPDFIFLDIDMPHMDGFQFIEAFNKLSLSGKEKINIVVLSSSETESEKKKVNDLGIRNYLSKPLTETMVNNLFS